MSTVGQKERKTQQRVVKLFLHTLDYAYLGNWQERENNRNIEPERLRAWLKTQGHADALIGKVLYELQMDLIPSLLAKWQPILGVQVSE